MGRPPSLVQPRKALALAKSYLVPWRLMPATESASGPDSRSIGNLTLLLGSTLSVLAVTILSPALPAMLGFFSQVPEADLLVRLVLTIPALFVVIGAPVSGLLLDKLGRKPVVMVALAVYCLAGSAGFYLDSIYAILLSRAVLGLAISAVMSGFTALIIDYFKGSELDRYMGYQSAFLSFGGMGFLFIGGLLADLDWRLVFLVHLVGLPILLSTMFTVREPTGRSPGGGDSVSVSEALIPYRSIGLIYLSAFVGMTVFFIFVLQVPFHLTSVPGVSGASVGAALSLQGLSAAIIAFLYMRIRNRLSFQAIFVLIFGFFGLNHLLLSMTSDFGPAVVALLLGGLGIGLLPANVNVWLASVVSPPIRGRAVGGLVMALFLGQFLTPFVSQPLAEDLGLDGMFLVFSGISFAAAAAFVVWGMLGQRELG